MPGAKKTLLLLVFSALLCVQPQPQQAARQELLGMVPENPQTVIYLDLEIYEEFSQQLAAYAAEKGASKSLEENLRSTENVREFCYLLRENPEGEQKALFLQRQKDAEELETKISSSDSVEQKNVSGKKIYCARITDLCASFPGNNTTLLGSENLVTESLQDPSWSQGFFSGKEGLKKDLFFYLDLEKLPETPLDLSFLPELKLDSENASVIAYGISPKENKMTLYVEFKEERLLPSPVFEQKGVSWEKNKNAFWANITLEEEYVYERMISTLETVVESGGIEED